jgi:glutamyl endopeptidase
MTILSSGTVFAVDDNRTTAALPMAMTSAEIAEFLENAEPVPMPSSNNNVESSRTRTGSYGYNMETGEVQFNSFTEDDYFCTENSSAGYTPDSLIDKQIKYDDITEPKGIVGTDDRVQVTNTSIGPWCNTVKLLITAGNGGSYVGSGFMIGPNSVATSGHCVYDSTTGGWASSITVIPALNGTTQPFGSATSYYLECGGDWYNYTDNQDDWGIIRINANLGSSTGWLGLRWQSSSYNGTTVNAVGYPASDGTHMYYGSGTVNTSSARTLSGDWDLTGGQSGGPVEKYYSDTGYTALGINRGGGSTYSDCLRIDQWIYNKLMSYRSLTY